MEEKNGNEKTAKKKSFFAGLFEKLDKKMMDKAKNSKCCCSDDEKGKSCCS